MTRFYLGTVATVPSISPTPNAEWDNTTGFIRRLAFPSAQSTAFSSTQTTDSAAGSNRDSLIAQYLYGPLDTAGTLTGTVKGQILGLEDALGANARPQMLVHICDGSGSIIGTAYAGDLATGTGNQANEYLTTMQNRYYPRGGSQSLTSQGYSIGDWLLMEVGWRRHATSGPRAVTLRFGDNASDLPENESQTTDGNAWIEFSHTFPGVISALAIRRPLVMVQ